MDSNQSPVSKPEDTIEPVVAPLPGSVVMPTPPAPEPEPTPVPLPAAPPVAPPVVVPHTEAMIQAPTVVADASVPVAEPTPTPVPVPAPALAPITTPAAAPDPVIADTSVPASEPETEIEPEPAAELVTEPEDKTFSWEASEYVHHDKGMAWYGLLGLGVIILLGAAYLTHQWLSIAVFVVMAVAVIVYAKKPPRTLTYVLGQDGITIDGHDYPYGQFRSFAVMPDLSWHAIDLEPTQRFMPRLTVLFESDDLDAVVGHLDNYLPRVDRQPDIIESLTRYLRF